MKNFQAIFLISFFICISLQGDIIKTFSYSMEDLTFIQKDEYQQVVYDDLELTLDTGLPQLPFEIIQLRGLIDTVVVESIQYKEIDGKFDIYPAQKPQILSLQKVIPTLSKKTSQIIFPENPVDILNKNGSLSSIKIFPLQYDASTEKLKLVSEIQLRFITQNHYESNSPAQEKIISKLTKTTSEVSGLVSQESAKYIIITSTEFEDYFEALREWKHKKGLSAKIITTEFIATNYTGSDLQEKIRNCIKYYYENYGTEWVLLGGDTDVIPDRKAWAFDCEADYADDENEIPCDLYYSDLDESWNADGDDIYGEVEDDIDLIPDVFVGRAPVENISDVAVFVNKILSYEKAKTDDYQTNMLFLAQVLWTNPYTDSGESKNYIDENFVPEQFDPIKKFYQSQGTADYDNTLEKLNSGMHIINHCGHAWYSVMSLGDGRLGYSEMLSLTNTDRYSIIYSIGCWPAAFDHDALAEDFITNSDGGGVAFIGNSRYGWGSPGNPLFGYSDRFDQQFFKQLFVNDIVNIGATVAAAKTYYAPLSKQENVYRWCQYEINLLGDPEMMIFTDLPRELSADFPSVIPTGNQNFTVYVHNENSAIEDATICITQDNGAYLVANTGADGVAYFRGNIKDTSDEMAITVTAHNYKPYEETITVANSDAFWALSFVKTEDLFSNYPKLEQEIFISPTIKNSGKEASGAVDITLTSENEKVAIIDSTCHLEQLASMDSVSLADQFSFMINDAFGDGETFEFYINITGEKIWKHKFSITAEMPRLEIINTEINKNNLSAGDNFQIVSVVENRGSQTCENFTVKIAQSDLFDVINYKDAFGTLKAGESDTLIFNLQVADNGFGAKYADIDLSFITASDYKMESQIYFPLGNFGLYEDFEQDNDDWNFAETENNQWHRSDIRKYAGNYSLYCGVDSIQKYSVSSKESVLESESFYPGKDGILSFYAWYEFPNYGTSGMNVEFVNEDTEEITVLDFIGSGGALGVLPTGNDWIKYEYDLSFLDALTSGRVRFRVNIDTSETPTEGIYIDNIKVEDKNLIFSPGEDIEIVPDGYTLHQNYPNPFNPITAIKFSLPQDSKISLKIFNIRGEVVKTVVKANYRAGTHVLYWNGENQSSGVYLYRLETEHFSDTKKCLLIK